MITEIKTVRRKLVSIQLIGELQPIPNADFIEKAIVQGWSVVVKKGEFQVGDLCAFFEIDSVLPECQWSEFMRASDFRVRTKKLRGFLSQGLALPLSVFSPLGDVAIGTDITEFCGVVKYESPEPVGADIAGDFPGFLPKTDEIRLQSAIGVIEELKGREVYTSVKLDGFSATYAKLNGDFFVCSRKNQLLPSDGAYWQMAEKYSLENLPDGYAIQGEICGKGIKKNRLNLKGFDFFVFTVFDIKQGQYLGFDEFLAFCDTHKLQTVPIRYRMKFDYSLEELLEMAEGFYEGTKNHREGIVIRPTQESQSSVLGGRLSIKVISNRYLLKGGEE